jgi:isoleucyl-tRNA synthetase
MQKYNVFDKPGYDMHGLPIEVKVEQSIGVKNKKEIEEYGIDRFVSTCKNFAIDFQKKMNEQFKEIGVWMDWDNPYLTITPDYIEAAWWTLKRAYDKGLLVQANRVLPCCPRCETALAEAEINYSDEKDPSIYVKFPLKEDPKVFLLIWTTTPWTLPANLAVAAHPDFKYIKARYRRIGETETVIVMKDLADQIGELAGWDQYEILEEIEGDDLVGLEYTSIFEDSVPYQKEVSGKWVHRVIASKTVEASNTGLVHIAPGFGPEDFELGKEYGIEPFCPVDETGKYNKDIGETYVGIHIKKANPLILKGLEDRALLFANSTIEHRYGHCWRCNSPVIFRTTNQWFLKVTQVKNQMLEEIERVRWTPDWAGSSREYDWVMNARDWCISRQRYWGIPIPVWVCPKCGEMRVIATADDLEKGDGYRKDMDLHRPWIDSVTFPCYKCKSTMRRVPDVLDVWFDSAVASWAQLGFPRKRTEFEKLWPAKWVAEGHDQTRGWFYSQLAAGVIAFGRAPYESVLMVGWMLDPKGLPMSKSRGNVIEPAAVVKDFGADALRFYLLNSSATWEDISFQTEGVKNARKMLNVFWNVVNFAVQYMSIDNFDREKVDNEQLIAHLQPEDRWLVSKTERLKNEVTRDLSSYDLHKATRAIENFVLDDLSRWYVRLIRDRMWKEEGDMDKIAAYVVLYDTTMAVNAMLAPICPHITERIYYHMDGRKETVHMSDWPSADLTKVDDRLETAMDVVKEIVEIITRERQTKNMKLRWPLKRMVLLPATTDSLESIRQLEGVLLPQANVKHIEYVAPGDEWTESVLNVVPNPNAIGKVYRQWASKIAVLLKSRPARLIKESVDKGEYTLGIEGQFIKIEPNMVSFETTLPDNVIAVKYSGGDIYLDFEITSEIEAEGYSREVIRRIQQMRKDMKLDVEEYITVEISAPVKIEEYLKIWQDHIMSEVRARKLSHIIEPKGEYKMAWDIDGEKLEFGVTSLHIKDSIEDMMKVPGMTVKIAVALIEAGYRTIESIKGVDEEKLSEIPGLAKTDVKKIVHAVARMDSVPSTKCGKCGGPLDENGSCPKCSCSDKGQKTLPKEKMMGVLRRIPRMNSVKAELVFDAGYTGVDKLRSATKDGLLSISGLGTRTIESIMSYISEGGLERCFPCKKCGTNIEIDMLVCPTCGTMVSVSEEAEEETQVAVEALKVEAEAQKAEAENVSQLEKSFAYLIKEEKPEKAYELFEKEILKGSKGLCITRNYPVKIKSKYNFGDTPMIWLSNVGKDNSLRPKDLEKLSYSLEQFLSTSEGIILLDGLEYLITNNNFLTVLRFVQSLRDQVAINKSILLMALNPSTLDPHELNLLEKEVDRSF